MRHGLRLTKFSLVLYLIFIKILDAWMYSLAINVHLSGSLWLHTVLTKGRQAGASVLELRGRAHRQDTLQCFRKLFGKSLLRGSPKEGRRKRCRQHWWWGGRSTGRDAGQRGNSRKMGNTNRHATATTRLNGKQTHT